MLRFTGFAAAAMAPVAPISAEPTASAPAPAPATATATATATADGAQRFLAAQFNRGVALSSTQGSSPSVTVQAEPSGQCLMNVRFRGEDGHEFDAPQDWTLLTAVRQDGSGLFMSHRSGEQPIRWDFGSSELAGRAANALEALRRACDPAADTGF